MPVRFALAVALCGVAFSADVRTVELIVAKVNGEIITRTELERERNRMADDLRKRGVAGAQAEKALADREKDLLREKIDNMLLVQKGKDLSISVDTEVSKFLAEIQLQNKIADQDKFQQWIRDQSGLPFEDFKSEVRNNYLTQRVIGQEVGSKVNVPKPELEQYYNEHKNEFVREERVFLREILVSTADKTDAEVPALEKKAKDLVERARRGEKFGELARDNSDSESAKNLGQLGAYKRADLAKPVADQVFDKDRGHVTDPIRVGNGFLILRVETVHKAGLAEFEEVQAEIMEKLYPPKFNPLVREYLTRLREEAFLEIREGYVDSGAAPGKDTGWKDPAELKPETVTKEEVAAQTKRKKLLWLVPIPGTKTKAKEKSSN